MTLDSTTSTNKNSIILMALGTTALSPLNFDFDYINIPTSNIAFEQLENNSWDLESENSLLDIDKVQTLQKVNALKSFSTSIIENSHSLDEETIEIINKNFWDWM